MKEIRGSRNPSTIDNSEHNDRVGAKKTLSGTSGQIKEVVADSSVEFPLDPGEVLRVCNTGGATAFIYIGEEGTVPGALDASTAIALPAGHVENIYCGNSQDEFKGLVAQASTSSVQVVKLER